MLSPSFRLLVVLAVLTAAVRARPSAEPATEAIFVAPTGHAREDAAIAQWQDRAQRSTTPAALERLGWAFVAKARATHDDGYYTLALLTAERLAQRHGAIAGERLLRGHVLLSLHRFGEAESIARELTTSDGSPQSHALLSDALLEQGRIQEAVAACQRFVTAQPGLHAYARVAHLRWLTGDLPGAMAAMEAAIRAGSPRDPENHAWALVRLGQYQLQLGQPQCALPLADAALRAQPGYPPALLLRGQSLLAFDRAADAVAPLQLAAEHVAEPNYQWWLADAQRAAGDAAAAAKTEATLARHGARIDPRTFALFLATRGGSAARAVSLAQRELEARADPHTHDALAWAFFAAGDIPAAHAAMQRALAAGTDDPRLHLHAAVIARAHGEPTEARRRLEQAGRGAAALLPSERHRLAAERAAPPAAAAH